MDTNLALLLASLLAAAKANYTFEIMVHGYRNPTHHSLGQASFRLGCCEGERTLPCSSCDNAFRFCLRSLHSSYDCDIGLVESQLIAEHDDNLTFSAGMKIGGLENPLLFSGELWPEQVEVLFSVYDLDGTVSISESSDLVDNIFITPQLSAHASFTSVITYMGNYSMLDISFRLVCGGDYYGSKCTFCVDTNDTSGHYTCDNNGKKTCLDGYQNITSDCTECVPSEDCDPRHGYCIQPRECLCKVGFGGNNCSQAIHPCYLRPCRNEGVCANDTHNPMDYKCYCLKGFKGRNCEETDECADSPCVHGQCLDLQYNYSCNCTEGYGGRKCDVELDICMSVKCGKHGVCVKSVNSYKCFCDDGYSGEPCEGDKPAGGEPSGNSAGIIGGTLGGTTAVGMMVVLVIVVICCLGWKIRQLTYGHASVISQNKSLDVYFIPTSHNHAYSIEDPSSIDITPYATVQLEPTYCTVEELSTTEGKNDLNEKSDGDYVINQLVYDDPTKLRSS